LTIVCSSLEFWYCGNCVAIDVRFGFEVVAFGSEDIETKMNVKEIENMLVSILNLFLYDK
jgi:hypothetical protein